MNQTLRSILTTLVLLLAAITFSWMVSLINQVQDESISMLAYVTSGILIAGLSTILIHKINM